MLTQILNSSALFLSKYKIKQYIAHSATDEELEDMMMNKIPNADFVLYQYISDDFRGPQFGSNRISAITGPHQIRLTNVYYQGYFPELSYLYHDGKHIDKHTICLQDNNLFFRWMWKVGGFKDNRISYCGGENLPIYDPNFYKRDYSLQEHHLSLAKLDWRDDFFDADVRVTDYIRHNFQKKRLFHTVNHPTKDIFYEEGRQIMKLIDCDPNTLSPLESIKDQMTYLTFPIYPSTARNLRLEFQEPLVYRYNFKDRSVEEMCRLSDNFYADIPGDIRDKNLNRILSKRISFW